MNRKIISNGTRFGKRTVLDQAGRTPNGYIRYRVQCDCGSIDVVNGSTLRAGKSLCCKYCANKARGTQCSHFKHGQAYHKNRTKIYNVWVSMRSRCKNPNDLQYSDYGGRGIKVCEEWNDFSVFYSDMGDPPLNHEIDRIDNNSGYSKQNCRWVTRQENCNNKRNNRFFMIDGKKVYKQQLIKILGISKDSLRWRLIRRGEEAVFQLYREKLNPPTSSSTPAS